MLTKMVDGVEVICSAQEETNIRAYWALNDAYPEFVGNCIYDRVNPPSHDMEECKKTFLSRIAACNEKYMKDLTDSIQIATEDSNDEQRTILLANRKAARERTPIDLSAVADVEALRNMIPSELLTYWENM